MNDDSISYRHMAPDLLYMLNAAGGDGYSRHHFVSKVCEPRKTSNYQAQELRTKMKYFMPSLCGTAWTSQAQRTFDKRRPNPQFPAA